MKATLEFNLPEDDYDFKTAVRASELSIFVSAVRQILKEYRKYKELTPEQYKIVEEIEDRILSEIPEGLPD